MAVTSRGQRGKGCHRFNVKMFKMKDHDWGMAVDHVRISEVMSPGFMKHMKAIGNSQYTISMNSNLQYRKKVGGHLTMSVDQEPQKEEALRRFRPLVREFAPTVNISALITVDGPKSGNAKKAGTKGENLYINNVPENTTKEQLKSLFPNADDIILPVTASGTSMGYALLRYDDPSVADRILKTSTDVKLAENILTIHRMVITDETKEGKQSQRPPSKSPAASFPKSQQKGQSWVKASNKNPLTGKKPDGKSSSGAKKPEPNTSTGVKKPESNTSSSVKKPEPSSSTGVKKPDLKTVFQKSVQKPLPSVKKPEKKFPTKSEQRLPLPKFKKKLPDSKTGPRQQSSNPERSSRDRPNPVNRGGPQKSILGEYRPPIRSILDKIPDGPRFGMRPPNQRGDFPREGGGFMGPPDGNLLGKPSHDVGRDFPGAMPIRTQGTGLLDAPEFDGARNFGSMDEPVSMISDLQMDREIVAKNLALMDDRDAMPMNSDILAARKAVARKLEQMEFESTDRRTHDRMDNRGPSSRNLNPMDDSRRDFDRSDNRRPTSMSNERRPMDVNRMDDKRTGQMIQDRRDNRSLLPLPMDQMDNTRQTHVSRREEKRAPPLIANPSMVRGMDHMQSGHSGRMDDGQPSQRNVDRRNDGLGTSRNMDRFEDRRPGDRREYERGSIGNMDDGRRVDNLRSASGNLDRHPQSIKQEQMSDRHPPVRRNPGQPEQRDQGGPSAREQVLDLKKEMQAQLVKMKKDMEREMEDKLERELSKREAQRLTEVREAIRKSAGDKRKQYDGSGYSSYDDPEAKHRKLESRWEPARELSPPRERHGRPEVGQSRSGRATMARDSDYYEPLSGNPPLMKLPTNTGYPSSVVSSRKPTTGGGFNLGGDAARHTGSAISVHTSAVPAPMETDLFARYRSQPKSSAGSLLPTPSSASWSSSGYPGQAAPMASSTALPTSKPKGLSMDYSHISSYSTDANEGRPMQVFNYNNKSMTSNSSAAKKPSHYEPPSSGYGDMRGQSSTSYSSSQHYSVEYDY